MTPSQKQCTLLSLFYLLRVINYELMCNLSMSGLHVLMRIYDGARVYLEGKIKRTYDDAYNGKGKVRYRDTLFFGMLDSKLATRVKKAMGHMVVLCSEKEPF